MLSKEVGDNLISFIYKSVYEVLAKEVGLELPEELALKEEFLSPEGDSLYYIVKDDEEIYTAFANDDHNTLTVGYGLVSTILALEENITSAEYDRRQEKAKSARKAISRFGIDRIKNQLRRLLEGEITIDESVYTLEHIQLDIDQAAYGLGLDLALDSEYISVIVEYELIS